jgi:hypothetical protein
MSGDEIEIGESQQIHVFHQRDDVSMSSIFRPEFESLD